MPDYQQHERFGVHYLRPTSEWVSRQQARIQTDWAGYWIVDSGSRNGTYVNGIMLGPEPQLLRRADLIELGGVETPIQWVFRASEATTLFPFLRAEPSSK